METYEKTDGGLKIKMTIPETVREMVIRPEMMLRRKAQLQAQVDGINEEIKKIDFRLAKAQELNIDLQLSS